MPPPGSPARPTWFEGSLLIGAVSLLLLRLFGAAAIPLSPDEAYYWLWTRPLQLSYFDHPPMIAIWIWIGSHLCGDNALGIRLCGVIASLLTTALVWDTARRLFASRRAAGLAGLALNSTPLFNVAAMLATPDNPLLLFWSLTLWTLVRLFKDHQGRYLMIGGLAGGLACLSKYTGLFLVPGLVATLTCFAAGRRWLARPALLGGLVLAAACAIPVVLWNAAHNWASFAKQWDHAFANAPSHPGWSSAATFVAGQAGLVTPILFVLAIAGMVWALGSGWRNDDPARFMIGAVALPMLVFFTIHAASATVQAHWSGPAYLGGFIGMGGLLNEGIRDGGVRGAARTRGWLAAGVATGLAVSVLIVGHGGTGMVPLPIRYDPLKRLAGWDALAAAVAAERVGDPDLFLFTDKHEPAGIVSLLLPDHPTVFLQGPIRPSYYQAGDLAALAGHDGLFMTRSRADSAHQLTPYFDSIVPLRRVTLRWHGQEADAYTLYRARGYKGGAFTAGDGLHGASDARSPP